MPPSCYFLTPKIALPTSKIEKVDTFWLKSMGMDPFDIKISDYLVYLQNRLLIPKFYFEAPLVSFWAKGHILAGEKLLWAQSKVLKCFLTHNWLQLDKIGLFQALLVMCLLDITLSSIFNSYSRERMCIMA